MFALQMNTRCESEWVCRERAKEEYVSYNTFSCITISYLASHFFLSDTEVAWSILKDAGYIRTQALEDVGYVQAYLMPHFPFL